MDISCFFQNKPISGLPGTLTQIFLHLIIIRVTGLLLLLGADQSFLLYLKSQSLLNFKTHATENYVSLKFHLAP